MGDRGNIVIRQGNTKADDVWFYGHWSGYALKPRVAKALAKHWRWNDSSYLARIVFDEFTSGQQGQETGFGISTRMQDNEYPILVVDVPKQIVYEVPEKALVEYRVPDDYNPAKQWTFEQFAVLQLEEAEA